MPTTDAREGTLDFVIAVIGTGRTPIEFLLRIAEKFDVPREVVEAAPTLPLSLGTLRDLRIYFHLSAYESERSSADGYLVVLGPDDVVDDDDLDALGDNVVVFEDARRSIARPARLESCSVQPGELSRGVASWNQ